MKKTSHSPFLGLITLAVIQSFHAGSASASTLYWEGAHNGAWGLNTNWSTTSGGGSSPTEAPGFDDEVVFNISSLNANRQINLNAAQAANSLTFDNTGTTTLSTAHLLSIGAGGVTVNAGAGAVTIASPVALRGAQSWGNSSSSLLTVSGGISNGGHRLTLGAASSGGITLSGGLSGSGGIKVASSGAGVVTLSGVNSFTGETEVASGTLKLGHNKAALYSAIKLTGGTVDFSSLTGAVVGSIASSSITGVISATTANSGFNFGNDNTDTTFNGIIQSTNTGLTISKIGAGTVTGSMTSGEFITGASSNGRFRLSGGAIRIAPTGSGSDVSISTGATTTASTIGGVGATIFLDKGANNSLTYTLNTSGLDGPQARGALVVSTKAGIASFGTATGERFIVSTYSSSANAWNGGSAVAGSNFLVIRDDNDNGVGHFANTVNGAVITQATYSNQATTFTPSSAGTYYNITAGGIGLTGDVTPANRAKGFRIGYAGAGSGNAVTVSNTVTSSMWILNGAYLTGGNLQRSATQNGAFHIYTSGNNTIASTIVDTNLSGLAKSGPGTLTLIGANTFTKALSVGGGTLEYTTIGDIGVVSSLGTGGVSGTPSLINLGNDSVLKFIGNANQSSNRGFELYSDASLDASGVGGAKLTLSGAIGVAAVAGATDYGTPNLTLRGNGVGELASSVAGTASTGIRAIIKEGSGTWTLSGANTYSGGTTVKEGLLLLGSATVLSDATGELLIDGGALDTTAGLSTIGGDLVLSSGTLSLNETNAGSLELKAGKNFMMSDGIFELTLGESFDSIVGTGSSMFAITGGSLVLDVTGSGFSYSDSYHIFSGFGAVNTVSNLLISGYDMENYMAQLNTVGELTFIAVPEPGSVLMVVSGLGAFLALRRRSRK